MSEVTTFDMPFDGMDDQGAIQETAIESAKADLASEAREDFGPPPEVAGVLEKYGNDPVKLAQAYRSLQQEFTRVQQGKAPAAPPEDAPPADDAAPPAELPPPEVITQLKEGLLEAAGGQQRFQAVQAWVLDNIPPGRIASYNAALQSGKVEEAVTAFKAMQYDYLQSNGYEGRLVGGRAPRGGEVKGFASDGEMTAAMSDPRYNPQSAQFDEGFHREVHRRLAVSG